MRVVIGQGSCGIAAGAEKVRKALLQTGIASDVSITGCIGMCYLEPIVDIYDDNNRLTRLVKVSENDAQAIADFVNTGDKSAVEKLIVTDEDSEFLSKQTRIALRNCGIINPEIIEEYIEKDGYTALKKALDMTPEEVISSLEELIELLGTYDITTIRASMGMYLLCKAIHEKTDIRVLLTGEISDELFGYKYTDFAPSASAFQMEAEKRIRELHMYDVLRADRCISVNSLEARVPFGDLDFVRYVMSLDPEIKINKYGKGKYLLRHAFEGMGLLPDSILWREKAAFSDAVGHSMVDYLKEYAQSRYSDTEFEELRLQYSHAQPFTKESLLYREIFEKYYPGQAEMITDFWMPNKEWEGCDVNDPSARVLSNYGESGK